MKGDILAQFTDNDQRSQLRQAELEVSRLKVEEQQFEALVKLNRSELDRELLLARQGLSSKSDVERSQYKLDQSQHENEKSQLATEAARARVEAVNLELEKFIRAPDRRYATLHCLGTNVARNDKLYEVSKLSKQEIRFRLPQTTRHTRSGTSSRSSAVNGDAIIAKARVRRIDPLLTRRAIRLGTLQISFET
jgi:multidrug efflux pump subunit AcrA (membrane-fusion protein)